MLAKILKKPSRFFVDQLQHRPWGLQVYAVSGLLMFAVIILGLFKERSD